MSSSTESQLESQSIGTLQVRVATLCFFAQLFDGFDISAISMAVREITTRKVCAGSPASPSILLTEIWRRSATLLIHDASRRPSTRASGD